MKSTTGESSDPSQEISERLKDLLGRITEEDSTTFGGWTTPAAGEFVRASVLLARALSKFLQASSDFSILLRSQRRPLGTLPEVWACRSLISDSIAEMRQATGPIAAVTAEFLEGYLCANDPNFLSTFAPILNPFGKPFLA
jgi:hypothetical protein